MSNILFFSSVIVVIVTTLILNQDKLLAFTMFDYNEAIVLNIRKISLVIIVITLVYTAYLQLEKDGLRQALINANNCIKTEQGVFENTSIDSTSIVGINSSRGFTVTWEAEIIDNNGKTIGTIKFSRGQCLLLKPDYP